MNEGKCIDGINDYTCECNGTDFTGDHCEINIDDCDPDPCLNEATCYDGVNDYQCRCYEGYTGKNCEFDIDECESSPCQYNGTCLERSNIKLYNDEVKDGFNYKFSYANASGSVYGLTSVDYFFVLFLFALF